MAKAKAKPAVENTQAGQFTKFRTPSQIKFGKFHGGQNASFKPPSNFIRTQHKG